MSIVDAIKDGIEKAVNETTERETQSPRGNFWNGGDLESVLEARAARRPGDYNWRTSVADLFRLLDLDPSYENRKELAQEMGRTDYSGTAEDNIWLHRETMRKLEANGARVPAELRG